MFLSSTRLSSRVCLGFFIKSIRLESLSDTPVKWYSRYFLATTKYFNLALNLRLRPSAYGDTKTSFCTNLPLESTLGSYLTNFHRMDTKNCLLNQRKPSNRNIFGRKNKRKTRIFDFCINLLALCYKCWKMIGYSSLYLFRDVQCVKWQAKQYAVMNMKVDEKHEPVLLSSLNVQ